MVSCFQHYVSESRIFLFSELNFAFEPLSYGIHVLVCWQRNWKLRTLCQKKQRFSFSPENTLLKLHNTENMFWLVGTKIGFFELYIAKSSVFAFCLLKHVALTQRSVCRKVVLFPWLLHGKKVFFQFAASHPAVLLILLKTTFFLVIG